MLWNRLDVHILWQLRGAGCQGKSFMEENFLLVVGGGIATVTVIVIGRAGVRSAWCGVLSSPCFARCFRKGRGSVDHLFSLLIRGIALQIKAYAFQPGCRKVCYSGAGKLDNGFGSSTTDTVPVTL